MHLYHYLRGFPATPDAPLNAGMEKAVGGLAAGLTAIGANTTILCEAMQPDATITRTDGVRVRSFDHRTTEHLRFGMPPSLEAFVRNELAPARADSLVVLNAIFHPTVHLLSKLFRKLGVSYVAAPHDPYHPAIFSGSLPSRIKKEAWWHLIEKPMLKHAAAVQVLDLRHGQLLRDRGVKTEAIEVVNGFAPQDVIDESTLTWRESGPIRILFLGRIDRQNKGLDLLVEAFAQLPGEIHLTLQGADHGDRAALEAQLNALQQTDRITILPPDFSRSPGDLAAEHDLFVMPSRFEGFGLSAMEAMLAARPLLITDIAGLAPHVRRCDAGVVVDATVESIRDGIERLIARRTEWQSMGMRGRAYVVENLDWRQIARKVLPVYQRLAG